MICVIGHIVDDQGLKLEHIPCVWESRKMLRDYVGERIQHYRKNGFYGVRSSGFVMEDTFETYNGKE